MGEPRFHLRWSSGRIVDDTVDDVQKPALEPQGQWGHSGTERCRMGSGVLQISSDDPFKDQKLGK